MQQKEGEERWHSGEMRRQNQVRLIVMVYTLKYKKTNSIIMVYTLKYIMIYLNYIHSGEMCRQNQVRLIRMVSAGIEVEIVIYLKF